MTEGLKMDPFTKGCISVYASGRPAVAKNPRPSSELPRVDLNRAHARVCGNDLQHISTRLPVKHRPIPTLKSTLIHLVCHSLTCTPRTSPPVRFAPLAGNLAPTRSPVHLVSAPRHDSLSLLWTSPRLAPLRSPVALLGEPRHLATTRSAVHLCN